MGCSVALPPKKIFYIITGHVTHRPAFANYKQGWTWIDWERIVWTDEFCFEIGKRFQEGQSLAQEEGEVSTQEHQSVTP